MSSGCAAFWRSPRAGIRLPKPPTLGTKRGGRRINGAYQNNSRTRNPKREAYPDLVERRLSADSPNRVWVADVTQHETDEGWLYLAVVIDVYSRLVVGWSFAERFTAELVLNALEMAL